MSDPTQKYFVSVEVKWGKDVDGVKTAESVGGQTWGALSYEQSVGIQSGVIVPGITHMLENASVIGLETVELAGGTLPAALKAVKDNLGKIPEKK